jgi:hypothetical protein
MLSVLSEDSTMPKQLRPSLAGATSDLMPMVASTKRSKGRVPVDVVSDDRYVASHRALCQAEFEIRKPTFSKGRGDVGEHRVEVRSRRARAPGADQGVQTLVPPLIGVAHARTSRRRPMQSNDCPIESFDGVFECESRRPAGPEDAAEYAASGVCSL